MLFRSYRIMSPALWDSIPESTNAEEAQHFKIYAAVGKGHSLLGGMECIVKFVEHYELLANGEKHGVLTRYGKQEPWKETAHAFGRTKLNRPATQSGFNGKTDSRPPDTSKSLLGSKRKRTPEKPLKFMAGCPWVDMSCWLDTSLQLFWMTAERDYSSCFKRLFSDLPTTSFLSKLANSVSIRFNNVDLYQHYGDGGCALLRMQRDGIRRLLFESERAPFVRSMTASQTLFDWLWAMFDDSDPQYIQAGLQGHNFHAFLNPYTFQFKSCVGSTANHWQVSQIAQRKPLALNVENSKSFLGDIQDWFKSLTRIDNRHHVPLAACWHSSSGDVLCDGHATAWEVFASLPVMLIFNVNPGPENEWDIRQKFSPLSQCPAVLKDAGVVYDLVGHAHCNPQMQHFTARFVGGDGKTVFDYDGMKHEGHAVSNGETSLKGLLTGPLSAINLSPGYKVYSLVYHLRGGVAAQHLFLKEQSARAHKAGLEIISTKSNIVPTHSISLIRIRELWNDVTCFGWTMRLDRSKEIEQNGLQSRHP
ncbi:hypothetical protein B0H10DRAFT_825258 [Mycena sp. CBHHK59/15]|nr:hypothetical protein B0H10DRAFT_825258 [Mycena sp. CBHHK59/15]